MMTNQPTSATFAQRRSVQAPAHDISGDPLRVRAQYVGFAVGMFLCTAVAGYVGWLLWPNTYGDDGGSAIRAVIGCALGVGTLRMERATPVVRVGLGALACALLAWAVAAQAAEWSGARVVGVTLCTLVAWTCCSFGYYALRFTLRDWNDWQEHLTEMRALYRDAYQDQGGQVVEEAVHIDDLSAGRTADVLATFVYSWITGKHSIDDLRGPAFLDNGRRAIRVGRISKLTAERISKLYGDAGIVQGRAKGRAGRMEGARTLEEGIMLLIDRLDRNEL